ncbi:MAG: MFS transporter [Gammaproteobacteria bacterium]|nr:MFS transporter [Gammaproteobacteria bacterium]
MVRSEFSRHAVAALGASMLGPGLAGIGTLAFPVFLTAIAAEYGGRGKVAGVLTAASISNYLGTLMIGAAVDRWGARRVVPLVSVFSAVATSLLAISGHFGLAGLFVLFALVGLGNSTLAAYSKLNAGWFHRRRGVAFALSSMGVGVIWMFLIPQTAYALLQHHSWRETYGIMGLFALLAGAPLVALLVRDPPARLVASTGAGAAEGVPAATAWRSAIFWLIIVGVCAETATMNSVRGHLVALLTDRGVAASVAVGVLSTTLIGTLIGQTVTGWMLDRFHTPRIVIPFALCSLLGVLLLAFGSTLHVWIAGNIIMSIGYIAELLMAPYFFTRFFGSRNHGKIYGSMFVCLAPITAIAPFAMGLVFDWTGSYQTALIAFAAALAIGGLALSVLPAYRFAVATQQSPQERVGGIAHRAR